METKQKHEPQAWDMYRSPGGSLFIVGKILAHREDPALEFMESSGERFEMSLGGLNDCEFLSNVLALPEMVKALAASSDALNAAYVWIAKNCKGIHGAAVIGAMLQIQHALNSDTLAHIQPDALADHAAATEGLANPQG